jgi:GNAT superfamily N-acetyltransferase
VQLSIASPEEQRALDEITFDAWGEQLTLAQFRAREARLRGHPWSRVELTTWLLRDGGAVLASCETYRMDSWLDGARGQTWGVASVFTAPPLRRRGYASRLMSLLVAEARAQAAHATILFSDVGAPIYEASGHRARPAYDLVFSPSAEEQSVDVLYDDQQLRAAFDRLTPPAGGFVVWPSAAQLDWHLERQRTYAALLGRPALAHSGARAGDGLIAWAADWLHQRLLVLLIAGARAEEAEALLRTARHVALQAGLAEVRLWQQAGVDGGGTRVARVGSLPMIAPLAPSLTAEMWTWIPRAVWV